MVNIFTTLAILFIRSITLYKKIWSYSVKQCLQKSVRHNPKVPQERIDDGSVRQ
jgi:hypothetical protein